MKPSVRTLTAVLTLIVMLWPVQGSAMRKQLGYSKEHPLIVGLDADYAPLEYVGEDGLPKGYDVEFTKILMQRMGVSFTYSPNTWEKIAGDVLHGRVDLGMMIYSDYRKDSTNYSRAVFRLYYQIVYRKADENTFDPRNLQGKHIAYMKSRPVGEMLQREGAVRHSITNLEEAMYALADGRYDAVVCFRYQARFFIVGHGLSSLRAEEVSLQPREYCYVSHSPELIQAINEELKLMEEEGIIDDVYGKEIKSQFGSIEIPHWVWYLLGAVVASFLVIFAISRYRAARRLKREHEKLIRAYALLAEKNEALIKANERAEESSRMKSSFIKQISHEIRTPLNIISGFTQIVIKPGAQLDDAARADIGSRISESADRITELINKMLELSEASSMTFIERADDVTAADVARRSVTESGIDSNHHIRFKLTIDPNAADTRLHTNLRMAARALALLLDNAQKFTKEGSVELRVLRLAGEAVAYEVEDTGIGVPPEEAEHIFDEFVQLDEYYDGTGIGLTVARSIARRLGGDITLDTGYKDGARFLLTLPLGQD